MKKLQAAMIGAFVLAGSILAALSIPGMAYGAGTVVNVGSGGTGTSTKPGNGQVLTGGPNGEYEFTTPAGSGTVTSVNVSGGTTGLTFSGGPIINNGTITMAGKLGIGFGGTGTSTSPTYGKVLVGDGNGNWEYMATSTLGITSGGGGTWGSITGTLSNQTDLQTALNLKLDATAFASNFDNRLSATTSLPNIITLGALSLPFSQTTGTVGVSRGGTGQTTFTSSQLLYGNGTNALTSVGTTTFTPGAEFTTTGTLGALVGGSNSTLALAANGVALTKLATIAANSVLGNLTGATGNVTAIATSSLFNNAGASACGLLTSTDWNTFNNKVGTARAINTTYPLQGGGDLSADRTLTLAFGTSTSNTWGGTQTYNNVTINGTCTGCSSGAGITSIGAIGQPQSGANQTFATTTSTTNGQTLGLTIVSNSNQHTFTPSISGTLTVPGGGTGQTTFTSSNLLYGAGAGAVQSVATTSETLGGEFSYSGTSLGARVGGGAGTLTLTANGTALTKLATIGANTILGNNTGATGNVVAFATSTLGIALSDTTGTLPVNRGGSGAATLTGLVSGNGTSAFTATANGTNGQVLAMSNGIPTWQATTTLSTISGTLPVTNGGTGLTSFTGDQIFYSNHAGTGILSTASSTLFGAGTPGFVWSFQNGAAGWYATSTSAGGTNYLTLSGSNLTNNVGNALGINANPILATLEVTASSTTSALLALRNNSGVINTYIDNSGHVEVGTSTMASGGLSLIDTISSGCVTGGKPSLDSLVLGGNPNGDTDFWICRNSNNDAVDNDSLQIGRDLTPGTNPIVTIAGTNKVGISSTTPKVALSVGGAQSTNGAALVGEYTDATSTSMTVDLSVSNNHVIRVGTAATAIAFSNFYSGGVYTLLICNPPAATAGAVTFSGVHYGSLTYTQTTTANQCDMVGFRGSSATSSPILIFAGSDAGVQ